MADFEFMKLEVNNGCLDVNWDIDNPGTDWVFDNFYKAGRNIL